MKRNHLIFLLAVVLLLGCRKSNAETWSLYFWSDAAYEADASYRGLELGPFVATEEPDVYVLTNVQLPCSNLKYCVHNPNWTVNYGWSEEHDGILAGIGETVTMGLTTTASGWCALPAYFYDVTFDAAQHTIRFDLIRPEGAKRVSILGDSYSTMYGCVSPSINECFFPRYDVQDASQTWWYQVIASGNYALERNNAYSGSTMTYNTLNDWRNPTEKMALSTTFIARATDLGNPDIILICGGTNDEWNNDNSMGDYKYSDWTNDDLYLFRPGTAYLMNLVKTNYPNAQVIFVLNDILPRVSESILTICGHYNIPVAAPQGIEKDESGHPTPAGMTTIADAVSALLNNAESVERVQANSTTEKMIENGQVVICRNGSSYSMLGMRINR